MIRYHFSQNTQMHTQVLQPAAHKMTLCSAWNILTDLTWMQDNSILRKPPNKISAKKNILQLISCSSYTKHVRFCLYQSVSLSPSSLCIKCPVSQRVSTGYTTLFESLHNHCWWDTLPCPDEPLTKRNHNMLLDSSKGVQSMVPCHELL